MPSLCLKCGHEIDRHVIEIVGNYDFVEISCEASLENEYAESCGCDAGFGKVVIKKEFNQVRNE